MVPIECLFEKRKPAETSDYVIPIHDGKTVKAKMNLKDVENNKGHSC